MSRLLICLLPKSAIPPEGRIWSKKKTVYEFEKEQDYYKGCLKAVKLANNDPVCKILMPSTFQVYGMYEADVYKIILNNLGILSCQIHYVANKKDGLETIGQLEATFKMAKKEQARLIVISTLFHFPRVWWLCRDKNVKHEVVFGIPRPSEVISDIILAFLFPFIDLVGLRKWFQKVTIKKRLKGKI